MDSLIKCAVSCDSLYGIIALMVMFIGFCSLGHIVYKIIQVVLHYIYKIMCKHCNTIKKYGAVHTKLGAKDVSVETKLRR